MRTCSCGAKTIVLDTREGNEGIVRRRECPKCKKRYITIETVHHEVEIKERIKWAPLAVSRNGRSI